MSYKITRSSTYLLCQFTVVFDTNKLTENAASLLTKDAALLLKEHDIGNDERREAHVFVRGGKVVALIQYTSRGNFRVNVTECEENCEELIQQLLALLPLYEGKA